MSVKNLLTVLIMISSKFVPIYNRFRARPVNCGKITTFKGVPIFDAFVREKSFRDFSLHRFDRATECDRQTNGQTPLR